jgi:ParB-like nuclease domain
MTQAYSYDNQSFPDAQLINLLRVDPPTVVCQGSKIDLFAGLMRDGVLFTPVQVAAHGGRYTVVNGAHRYWSSQKIGYPSIPALIANSK